MALSVRGTIPVPDGGAGSSIMVKTVTSQRFKTSLPRMSWRTTAHPDQESRLGRSRFARSRRTSPAGREGAPPPRSLAPDQYWVSIGSATLVVEV